MPDFVLRKLAHLKILMQRSIVEESNARICPQYKTHGQFWYAESDLSYDKRNLKISIRVAFGKNRTVYPIFTETEMKRLFFMRHGYVRQFTETTAAIKLPEHKNEQLIPIRQLPSQCWVCNFVFYATGHDSFKFSFWQKVSYLAENISSCIHVKANMRASPNIANSKVRQGIGYLNVA